MALSLTSTVFTSGSKIPRIYTCDGKDIAPPLTWHGSPEETKAFTLIVDDPDAPGKVFTHWVIFNIPSSTHELQEATPRKEQLSSSAIQGMTDFGRIGYGGPCPPRGPAHRYHFSLYALDKSLELNAGASKEQVLEAMNGHVLAKAKLIGLYQR